MASNKHNILKLSPSFFIYVAKYCTELFNFQLIVTRDNNVAFKILSLMPLTHYCCRYNKLKVQQLIQQIFVS